MDLRIVELQRQLPANEANTFAYKFERRKKSVTTAVLLALFLGGIGVHRFWFNEIGIGLLYLIFCWTFIPGIIALIECFFMKQKVDDYNYELAQEILKEIVILRKN